MDALAHPFAHPVSQLIDFVIAPPCGSYFDYKHVIYSIYPTKTHLVVNSSTFIIGKFLYNFIII